MAIGQVSADAIDSPIVVSVIQRCVRASSAPESPARSRISIWTATASSQEGEERPRRPMMRSAAGARCE